MAEREWSLPAAWKNGELTPEGISSCHQRLLPDVRELESDLGSVEKSVRGYLDAVSSCCRAGSALSSNFSKLLRGTTLTKISQQYQQVTEQLEHSAHESSVDITNCVMATLCDFTSTLPGIKREIESYKRYKDHYEKCRVALESFAQKDASASEGKRFQLAKERFHAADNECTMQQEQLSQCLSSLEGNRIKMLGASLLSLLHTVSQFFAASSSMLAPLGEYQSVGDYLRDREIAPQLKEATAAWCSIAQGYQSVRDCEYLSVEEIYKVLEHRKGVELSASTKYDLGKHLKMLLENYKKEVEDIDDGPVIVPGGFTKNPAGIALALKGCCSKLEILGLSGIRDLVTPEEIAAMLKCEIPKVQLAVCSVGKLWCTINNLKDSDELLSRQHKIQDLIEPIAKQFDIPFTKESLKSFTLTVLNEACSEKTILASKIAVQLMYGKADLVVVKLSPESSKSRLVRVNCKETSVSIEVQLTWWITADQELFSGILTEDESEPLLRVNTTYCTAIDYMDYLEEKGSALPSITVEFWQDDDTQSCERECDGNENETACKDSCPVAPPRTKHYARKIAERRKKGETNNGVNSSVGSTDERKSRESLGKEKGRSLSVKSPFLDPSVAGTISHLSLASESELSEVINFLSGFRGIPDSNDADTESVCSMKAMSDSGIDSVKNAKLVGKTNNSGEQSTVEKQTKGKKGKKKDKATAKGENNAKKKKKKRGDKAKKEKKKAANGVADEQDKTATASTKEELTAEGDDKTHEKRQTEEISSSQSKISTGVVDYPYQQNSEDSGQKTIILSERLRSVWEPSNKDLRQLDSASQTNSSSLQTGNLSKQSALFGSQDSIYHSCWSLPGLGTDGEDLKSATVNEPDLSTEFNYGRSWSNAFEHDRTTQNSIWSHPPSKFDHSQKEPWPPALTRQDGVDFEETDPPPVAGESVFSLGLGITGFELFAAAKQAGLPSNRKNNNMNEKHSSMIDNRNTTSQPPIWAHGNPTPGQFTEKSSSCGDGLHRPFNYPPNHVRLQARHSDPFLTKSGSWRPPVPPMYMKVRYNPNIITPFPMEDMPGSFGTSLQTTAGLQTSNPNHPLPTMDQRRNHPNFYVP